MLNGHSDHSDRPLLRSVRYLCFRHRFAAGAVLDVTRKGKKNNNLWSHQDKRSTGSHQETQHNAANSSVSRQHNSYSNNQQQVDLAMFKIVYDFELFLH